MRVCDAKMTGTYHNGAPAIDAVLFDKDGTLFRVTSQWEVWFSELIGKLSKQTDLHVATALADALKYNIESGVFVPGSPVNMASGYELAHLVAQYLPNADVEAMRRELEGASHAIPMDPAVPLHPLLTELRNQGLRIGLSTNDTEAAARQHLRKYNLLDLFDFVAGYDSGFGAKPGSGMQRAFADFTHVPGKRIAMVGDSLYDLTAGRGAGMVTVGVLSGPTTAEILAPMADVILPDIGHLPRWLTK